PCTARRRRRRRGIRQRRPRQWPGGDRFRSGARVCAERCAKPKRSNEPPGREPGGLLMRTIRPRATMKVELDEERTMASVKLPDGSIRQVDEGSTVMQVAESIGKGLAKAAVAARVDGKVVDLSHKLPPGEHQLAILTDRDPDALQVLRHSAAHVMAEAIQRLWPKAQLAYGPPIENGFYYDIALDTPISTADFEKIEKEMAEIVKEDRPFTRYELPATVALPRLCNEGNQYKIDNANRAVYGSFGADEPGTITSLKLKVGKQSPFELASRLVEALKDSNRDSIISFYVTG